MLRTSALVAAVLGAFGVAHAQDQSAEEAPRKEGDYQGVTPGESERKPRQTSTPRVTWIGFQPKADGNSRFFIQINAPVDAEPTLDDKNVLHVTLPGAVLASRNAKRRLDTRFFDTAVADVSGTAVRRSRKTGQRAGVRYSFRFKSPEDAQQPKISVSKEEDGYHYVYLDFGPAKVRPEDEDDDAGGGDGGDLDVTP